jgi:hypothetical protein
MWKEEPRSGTKTTCRKTGLGEAGVALGDSESSRSDGVGYEGS